MIATVLLENIYYVLKDNQRFEKEKYAEKLNGLQGKHKTSDKISGISDKSVQEMLEQIEYNTGTLTEIPYGLI